ncbi:dnaJ homolog subfamily C member 14 [Engraulis encrasicolus]|uniref:dnaJ homolog subfamily C member 14 n=1 Tax=Engraulis encrasicolus TaxID=184585 RepID=UPI002FD30300
MDDATGECKNSPQDASAFSAEDLGDPKLRNDDDKEALSGSAMSEPWPSGETGSRKELEDEEERETKDMLVEDEPLDSTSPESPQKRLHSEDSDKNRDGGENPQKDGEGEGEGEEEDEEEEEDDSEKEEAGEAEGDVDEEESQAKDAGKETRMNGESGSRTSGRRGRSRNSSSAAGGDQAYTSPTSSSSFFRSPFSSSSSYSSSGGGGRHKQARRRNHHHHQGRGGRRQNGSQLVMAVKEILSESISPWCMSCIHMVVELIVSVAHHCGMVVESASLAVYDFSSRFLLRVTDLPGLKQDARRGLAWGRGSAAALVTWTSRVSGRAWHVSTSCFGLLCAIAMLAGRWAQSALGRLSGGRAQLCWEYLQNSWPWMKAAALLGRVGGLFRRSRSHGAGSTPESPSGGRCQPGQELERLLSLAQVPEDELDPFAVLGVEANATESELKRAYRQLAVQVHPDKNKHPRAGEAFKVLRAAWDVVSNPETRREYEMKRMAATELSKSMNEFLTKLQDDLKEAMNTMMCTKCEGKHKRFEMDRDPSEARFCAECNRRHGAEEGDLWAESSMLGLRITYFAFMDGKVYDITEWAGCQRIGISPDTHRVPYHISFGSKTNSNPNRHRTSEQHPPPGPSSPADLQDLFNRIFQGGGSPSDMAANGGFFPTGSAPHQPPGAPGGMGGGGGPFPGGPFPGGPFPGGPFPGGPSPPGGFFPHGPQQQHRAEPSEQWTEGGKHPRRRKKVRKPFQR